MKTTENTANQLKKVKTATKQKQVKKPTIRQRTAMKLAIANGGNVSKAMRDAGYSPATAKNPQKLTESQAFVRLMDKAGITDDKLISTLRDGLNASYAIVMGKDSNESFVDIQPDHKIRHKFLETALRLKGRGVQDQGNTFNFNFGASAKGNYVNED